MTTPTAVQIRFDGACREVDPVYGRDLHFPVSEAKVNQPQITRAKAVCASCPVLQKCLRFAMHQTEGIWAGMTESERRAIRVHDRRRELAAAAAEQDAVNELDAGTRAGENAARSGVAA